MIAGRRPRVAPATAIAAMIVATLGAACVAPPAVPAGAGVDPAVLAERRDAAAAAFDVFRVRGGLGVWNDERSVTARIDWRQRGEALDIGLAAPLGLGNARLVSADGRASLTRGDAPPITGRSADEVLQRALGLAVPVPLDQLAAWLRGLPGDGRDVRRDDAGRLVSLRWRDAGGTTWAARVLVWTMLDGLELPALVTARGAGYRVRLVLRDWSAGSEPGGSDQGAIGDDRLTPEPAAGDAPKRRSIPSR